MAKAWRALFGCIVATAGLAVVADRAAAAPGDLDVSYGSNGVSTLAVPPSSTGFVNRYLPLSDGGYYATAPGGIARFSANGDLDPSYGTNGVAPISSSFTQLGTGPDGSIVTADRSWRGARYQPDGSVDPSFSFARPAAYTGNVTLTSGPKLLDSPSAVTLTADGVVHVIGLGVRCDPFTPPGQPTRCANNRYVAEMLVAPDLTVTVRIGGASLGSSAGGGSSRPVVQLPDGSVVAGRPATTGIVHPATAATANPGFVVTDIAIDAAGRIVAAGVNNVNQLVVARYVIDVAAPSISQDPAWGAPTTVDVSAIDPAGATQGIAKLLVAADGSVYVAGNAGKTPLVARLDADGVRDTSFGGDGFVTVAPPVQLIAPSTTVAALRSVGADVALLGTVSYPTPDAIFDQRFDASGVNDASWGTGGLLISRPFPVPYASSLPNQPTVVGPDGSTWTVWALGQSGTVAVVGRALPNGQPDPAFGVNGIVVSPVEMSVGALALDPAQRVVVAGQVSDGSTSFGIMLRFMPTGALDPTFGQGGEVVFSLPAADSLNHVAIDSAGRILVAATTSLHVFDSSGAPSTAYSNYAGWGNVSMLTHSDGTVSLFQGFGTTSIVRVAPDNTVISSGQFEGRIQGPVLPDGPTGYMAVVYIPNQYGILRVDATGAGLPGFGGGPTAPAGFLPGDAFGFPFSFVMAGDGTGGFVVLGPDTDPNKMAVAHLTSAGTPDPSFGTGGRVSTPLGNNVSTIAMVPRGILAAITGLDATTAVVVQLTPPDTQPPTASITTPADGSSFSLGQTAAASYTCDDAGASGLASCSGSVLVGAPIDTTTPGQHTFTVTAVDGAGNQATVTSTYQVLAGDADVAVVGPQTVSTDPGGVGATPAVPLQTQVAVPAGVTGQVTIAPGPVGAPPAGFVMFGRQATISAPVAPDPSQPYLASFTIDSSELGGTPAAAVGVFRNGVAVAACTDPTAAVPDPCIASRTMLADGSGDAVVVVRTTQFSAWSFGRPSFIVDAVTPASRAQGASAQTIQLQGDGFQPAATVKFSGTGISIASTVVSSPTSITVTVTVAGSATAGPRDVTVTNPGKVTTTCRACFAVNLKPAVSAAAPSSLPQGASHRSVVVSGSDFLPGAVATISRAGVTVHTTSFVSATTLALDVSVDPGAVTGSSNIVVLNPDGGSATGTGKFSVNAVPTATSVTPVAARRGQTANVSISGSGFAATFATAGGSVQFGPDVTINSVTRNSATKLTANVTVGTAAAVGPRSVTITNPDGGSATCTSCVTIVADPVISGVAPLSSGQGVTHRIIVVSGNGFEPGATAKVSLTGVAVNSVTVNSPTSITLDVSVGTSAAVGPRDVTITNTNTGTATCVGCFTVAAKPTVTSLTPSALPRGSVGRSVIVAGTGFQAGVTVTFAGSGVTAAVVSATSTSITLSVDVASGAVTGNRSLTVTNPDAGTATKSTGLKVT